MDDRCLQLPSPHIIENVSRTMHLSLYINMGSANVQETFGGIVSYDFSIFLKEAANNQEKCVDKIQFDYHIHFTIGISEKC